MKLTRRQLRVLVGSLLYEASPYPYMSSPEEIAKLEAEQEYKQTGTLPNIEAVEEEFEEEKVEKAKSALTDIFFAAAGIGLAIFKAPFLLGVGFALASGYITIPQAYERIVRVFIKDKDFLDQVPDEISTKLGIADEVLELLDDDLVEALPTLYANNVLTPSYEAGKNIEDIMPISEYLDAYLKKNSNNQLGLLLK